MRFFSLDAFAKVLRPFARTRVREPSFMADVAEKMPDSALPEVFDAVFYRSNNVDLKEISTHELEEHYIRCGIDEGRLASRMAVRENFTTMVMEHDSILEIGPFCNPVATGQNVKYFDVLDTDGLRERASSLNLDVSAVPKIDYVSPTGDIDIIGDVFSAIVSSHSIEHQPDLINHLQKLSRRLSDGGRYYIIIPDKRFCFDYFLPTTTIADVIEANYEKRMVHSLRNIIEHYALTTHNDPMRHWHGDHGAGEDLRSIPEMTRASIAALEASGGGYVDVHAWKFTPDSFERVVSLLFEMGYTDLYPLRVYHTPFGRMEFTAVLEKRSAVDGLS